MISLNSSAVLALRQSAQTETEGEESNSVDFANHQQWNYESGWKNVLNSLQLIV